MYPLWGQFIGQLADYAVTQGKAQPKDANRWKADTGSTPQQRVRTILRKLGDAHYHQFLKETFGPRLGDDGKRFTPTHAALLRLPFRGYVTTNYDPALEFARMELRPGCLTTGTPTWQDDDEVYRWLTGDVFGQPDSCPILWLHGYWQRPSGIVLNAGEYRDAYRPGLYRKTFERLWEQDHLVSVGFGFNDPQFTFMVGEILRDIADANALPRHIAILGMGLEADGTWPDKDTIQERRENMEADYHVRPLFYRVRPLPNGGQDHDELSELLEGLAPARAVPPPDTTVAVAAPLDLRARWVHETTDDDKFTGRDEEQSRLDRWVRDPAIRVIGVCAVGGTGKTALVGHWLKNTKGWQARPFAGLFGWSFYQERDSGEFLRELLLWAHETFDIEELDENTNLVTAALTLLRERPLVVVLDGLEVLQDVTGEERHGTFLDGVLRELLGGLCAQDHGSLAVLTSRIVFADLERHIGTAFHQFELGGLPEELGAALLGELAVRGTNAERVDVTRRLEGHPLGLRVFAEAIPDEQRDQPVAFLEEAFRTGKLDPDAPLSGKVLRLLTFYQEKLPPTQVRLLSIVALFRSPVAEETVVRLAHGLFGEKDGGTLPDDSVLGRELALLHARGVLSHEPIEGGHGYACHPILRDHFRRVLLGAGAETAQQAANLLQGEPASEEPRSVKEIEPVLDAVGLLLDAGEFKAADQLCGGRLEDGRLLLNLPAAAEGLCCALGFVGDGPRRKQCEEKLSRRRLGFYLNDVGLFAGCAGHYELAARFFADRAALAREMDDAPNLSVGLQNRANLSVFEGQLADASESLAEARDLALRLRDEEEMCDTLAYLGWVRTFLGRVRAAAQDFAAANALEKKNDPDDRELYGYCGTQWEDMLRRVGHPALAARRAAANLRICERKHWNADVARCRWVMAGCALADGELEEAETQLREAESVFRGGQMLFDLARVHVTAGEVAIARRDAPAALGRAAEALALAQPRGMRLVHADALVVRGRARLLDASEQRDDTAGDGTLTDSLSRALDDADDALRLARECSYAWAERDALWLQADTHAALASAHRDAGNEPAAKRHRAEADRTRGEAEALASRLRLTEEDLARAEAEAAQWLRDWEKEDPKKE